MSDRRVDCPIGLRHDTLNTCPTSLYARLWSKVRHKKAREYFDGQRKLMDRPLDEALPGLAGVTCQVSPWEGGSFAFGNVQPLELMVLATTCAFLTPRRIFEFGTFDGMTTLHLAMNTPGDTVITTLDLHPNDPARQEDTVDTTIYRDIEVGRRFRDHPLASKVRQVFSDSTCLDTTPYRAQQDVIFIDGGHEYSIVRSDTLKALEMVTPGGIIFWHDYYYHHFGVYTWLNELAATRDLATVPGTTLAYHINR